MDNTKDTIQALNEHFGLQLPVTLTEDEIIALLTEKIILYLDKGAEAFFQLMYRLDIPEQKFIAALDKENTPQLLARLIYERQLQKIQSRALYRNNKNDDDPELSW